MKEAWMGIPQATESDHDKSHLQIQYHPVPWSQIAIQIYSPANINPKKILLIPWQVAFFAQKTILLTTKIAWEINHLSNNSMNFPHDQVKVIHNKKDHH